jgi:hypothetical protein
MVIDMLDTLIPREDHEDAEAFTGIVRGPYGPRWLPGDRGSLPVNGRPRGPSVFTQPV